MATGRKPEQPLWAGRKSRKKTPQGLSVSVNGRSAQARHLRRELATLAAQQAAGTKSKTDSPPVQPPSVFRFRRHLAQIGWLGIALAGLVFWGTGHPGLAAVAAGGQLACVWVFARSLKDGFSRCHTVFSSVLAGTWLAVLSHTGPARPWAWLAVASWAASSLVWVHHYKWAPPLPGKQPDTSVADTWAALAKKRGWASWLGDGTAIENGMSYPVHCKGTDTHIGEIVSQPLAVAAAYGKPVTEAYVEQAATGRQDMGRFVWLKTGTLDRVRMWDGIGIDMSTGMAVVGRFPDGKPVRERYFSLPQDGTKHTIISGADGSGKTGLINTGLCISARSSIIAPVILDPQEGQALPAWRDHVPYACGVDECMVWLKALREAMMDRSRAMGQLRWYDDRSRKLRRGLGFYSPFVMVQVPGRGLVPLGDLYPIIEVTIDESPILLAIKGTKSRVSAKDLLLDLAKLGRKTGLRLRLAAQVPSLSEMKAQELRSILVGGNVFCLRSGDKVSGQMMTISANPWELPRFFADGSPTWGLGYCITIDGRYSTPMRTDLVPDPYEVAETTQIRKMDDGFAARMAEVISQTAADTSQLQRQADSAASQALIILGLVSGTMSRGEIVQAALARDLGTLSEITRAVSELARSGQLIAVGADEYQVKS